jgi:lipopolysaccharide biosynthesis glycosyltransferase
MWEPYRIFIGYDSREIAAFNVCVHSIIKHSTRPVSITPLNVRHFPWFTNNDYMASTEFAFTRFLVPYLSDYRGISLFLDGDMLVRSDIDRLFCCAEPDKVVSVVKHNYRPKRGDKFLGQRQSVYDKKNWSSVMLFNNEKCRSLTPDYVNMAEGLDLHKFNWCKDKDIGELPKSWNYLVGEEIGSGYANPDLVHYTLGGPYFKDYEECEYADEWFKYWQEANSVLDRRVVNV